MIPPAPPARAYEERPVRHDPEFPADGNPTNLRHCTWPDCEGMYYARGMCVDHYTRWYNESSERKAAPMTVRSGPSYCRGGKGC